MAPSLPAWHHRLRGPTRLLTLPGLLGTHPRTLCLRAQAPPHRLQLKPQGWLGKPAAFLALLLQAALRKGEICVSGVESFVRKDGLGADILAKPSGVIKERWIGYSLGKPSGVAKEGWIWDWFTFAGEGNAVLLKWWGGAMLRWFSPHQSREGIPGLACLKT
jgi:hypothetical protein